MSLVKGSNSALSSSSFFLLILVFNVKALLRGGLQFLAIKLLELLDCILINWVNHVRDLQTLLAEGLQERRGRNCRDALTSDVVDVVLSLLHAIDVFLEGDQLIAGLGGVETEQLSNLGPVGGILVHTKLEALAELLIEFFVVILLLCDLGEHLQALLHQVFLDDAEDLVLLESLTRDVEGQVLGVDNSLDHVEPLGHQLVAVVHDEHSAHVQLDVVALLLGFEEVERSTAGNEQQSTELELSLNAEVLDSEVILPVVRQGLVEGCVLLVGHVLGLAHPQGLVLVQLLPLMGHLLDLLGLLLLGFLLLLLIDFLDLGLIAVLALFLLLLFLVLGVSDLLLLGFLHVQLDGEPDELGVFLHQVLQAALLKELRLILLQVADHLGSTLHLTVHELAVLLDGEGSASGGLPDVLLVIVVLADHADLVGDEVCGVETDTELSDHGNITACGHGLHERLGAGLGDGAEVIHQLVLGHANSRILDGQGGVGLVGDDLDVEVWLRLDLLGIGDRLVADLVQSIGGVGNQFSQEDFLVGVERVDDQAHQLLD